LFLLVSLYTPGQGTVYQARSFYGVHRVVDIADGRFRLLFHGTTAHGGEQLLADDGSKISDRPSPLTYYYRGGPYSQAIDAARARAGGYLPRVGLIGLGAGISTCHRLEREAWDLYELDPLVIRIARNATLFRAVTACAPDAAIIAGDARLTLQKAKPGYDLLVVDAFTSDAIPVHLLTREAVALYKQKLGPNGVITFNISNRNLELPSVVAASAAANNLVTIVKRDGAKLDVQKSLKLNAEIAMVARSWDDFGTLKDDPSWKRMEATPGQSVWTDDYASIVSALVRKVMAPAAR
jgi:spermidine synthase